MRILPFFFPLLFLCACKNNETSIYEGCCGAEPTTFDLLVHIQDTIGSLGLPSDTMIMAHVFIPNIFTPGKDSGYNAPYFFALGGIGLAEIRSMIITDNNAQVLFSKDLLPLNSPEFGWDGHKPDGTFYYGSFNYEIKIRYVDEQIKTFTGRACSYQCGDPGFPNEDLPDCFFPYNNNGKGQGEHNYPYDPSCFE